MLGDVGEPQLVGAEAANRRSTRSSHVGAFLRFFTPFLGPGRPLRPSWRMIFHTASC